jgi:hypothetical protein
LRTVGFACAIAGAPAREAIAATAPADAAPRNLRRVSARAAQVHPWLFLLRAGFAVFSP